jgi:hypothetical protein
MKAKRGLTLVSKEERRSVLMEFVVQEVALGQILLGTSTSAANSHSTKFRNSG